MHHMSWLNENFCFLQNFLLHLKKTWVQTHQQALGVCQRFYIIAKYLNAGLGLDWAGHVRASEFSFAVNICSMATDENFGGELPIGSDGKIFWMINYQKLLCGFYSLLECLGVDLQSENIAIHEQNCL